MVTTGEDTNEAQPAVSKLIKLLAGEELAGKEPPLSSTEIAETLWLSLQIASAPAAVTSSPVTEGTQKGSLPPIVPTAPANSDAAASQAAAPTRADLTTPTYQTGVLPVEALPVWIADPPMLRDPLAVMKALKPLLKQVAAGTGQRLDEIATVDGIARTQLWLPVMEPETQPWFDIILVVDRGSSMHIWQRLIKDLERTFRRYGAFRNLQLFNLDVSAESAGRPSSASGNEAVRLKSHPERIGHRPSELIEQSGQRIAIVLSDCAGEYWWDGRLLPMLETWAQVMPTVVWQMLPEWMWERTALGQGKAIALSNDEPGAANQQLNRSAVGRKPLSKAEKKQLPVPVMTSEPRDLHNWSLMLAGDRREQTPGFLLPRSPGQVPKVSSEEGTEEETEEIAKARVKRFLQLSSPPAQRLIMLLAAAPVITLPVMRLIRDSMLSEYRSPLPVAEVFLSGLLERLSGQSKDDETQTVINYEIDHDVVQYDFAAHVRQILLKKLPEVDTIDVLNSVSSAVENRWNAITTQDFRAFLTDPSIPAPEGLSTLRAFGSVAADILKPLGGEYERFAEQLRRGAEDTPDRPVSEPDLLEDFEVPSLKDLEFFRAEVREETPPVQLVMDEFEIAIVEFETEINVDERLAEIVAIEDESARAAALIELAPQLEGQPFNLLVRVMTVVQAIQNKRARLDVLSAMLPHLPDRLQGQVLDLISELEEPEGPELVEFEFEVARVVRQRSRSKMGATGRTVWAVQRDRQAAYQFIEPLDDATKLEMVAIPAGTFMMGSPESEPERSGYESPQHEVSVTAFFMGRYPITQAQWRFVAGLEQVERTLEADPARFKGDDRPVEKVSWHEAVEFCDRLSRHTGNSYRLPSEAQWEYACRAGTQSPFYFGDTISSELANYRGTTVYNGGPEGKHRDETTSVDYFNAANAFGLSDMHGNVWEWCADHWRSNYKGAPTDGSAWITENEDAQRVRRGGSWLNDPGVCRSATRFDFTPDFRDFRSGFRVCCLAPRTPQPPTD